MRAPVIVLTFFLFLIAFGTLWVTASFINAGNIGYALAGGIQTSFFFFAGTHSLRCLIRNWNRWT